MENKYEIFLFGFAVGAIIFCALFGYVIGKIDDNKNNSVKIDK